MRAGYRSGNSDGCESRAARGSRAGHDLLGIGCFVDDEGGYTTVAVAVALLVSIALVFGVAGAQWVQSRSADVQAVADASALAGADVVAAYSTIAQVLDACVLSLGLLGVLVLGAGLVLSAIPGLRAVGASVTTAGRNVLDARQRFARSCSDGLEKAEAALPAVIVARSAQVVRANSEVGDADYVGCAIPYLQESQSDFGPLEDDVDGRDLADRASELQKQSAEAEAAHASANEALERGWQADCGDEPYCLWQRAATLAGLSDGENPRYPSSQGWNFGAPLERARAYYRARTEAEAPYDDSVDELTNSAAREAFYRFAADRMNEGYYLTHGDGTVSVYLPELPHTTDGVRATSLYLDPSWPVTNEGGTFVLHSSPDCPAATGESQGLFPLAALDAGLATRCPICGMDVDVMGEVAAASTSTGNGFEHYWRIIAQASRDFEGAHNREAKAEAAKKKAAEGAGNAFDQAINALKVPRPTLCPPGAWGCVSVVVREGETQMPSGLTGSFLPAVAIPPGVAVAAATLAPDSTTSENNVLASFFDAVAGDGEDVSLGGVIDGVMGIWGSLLMSYGSGYGKVSDTADDLFGKLDKTPLSPVSSWLRDRITQVVHDAGFEPNDMRLRKPVLTNSANVLRKGGVEDVDGFRRVIEAMPADASDLQLAVALGLETAGISEGGVITIAELPIPGTDRTIPLTIDMTKLGVAA